MPLRPLALAALVLPALLAGTAAPVATEDSAPPTAAERAAKVMANLPKPGSGARLAFEGEMLDQGTIVGTLSLSVEGAPAGGPGAWRAVDEMRVGPDGAIVHVRSEALLDAQLKGLEGRTVSKMQGEPTVTLSWKREGEGYAFTRQEGEVEPTRMRLESLASRVPTMAALVFLALELPVEGGAHAVDVLLVDANLGDDASVRARTQTLTPLGVGLVEVGGVPKKLPRVALTRAGKPGDDSTLALAGDRKGLVQVDQAAGGTVLRLPPPAGPFDFRVPATTAAGAALQAARAFAVADLPALEAVLNWPSVDARLASNPGFASLEPAARRKKVLEELAASLEANPPELIEMVLRGMLDTLQVDDLGQDRARVTFPPLFRSLKLVVKKVGEVWLLDELPGATAPEPPGAVPPPTPAPDDALARSAELRALLPVPGAPWSYEGEVYFQGFRIGSLAITAEPGTFQGKPCWQVVERSVREAGKSRVVSELALTLAPDLSLLRGEAFNRAPGGSSVTSFGWRDGALEVVEQLDGGTMRSATPQVAPASTLGLFALARFLLHLPDEPARDWRLPVFDPRFAFGDDAGKPLASDLADLALTVVGPSSVHLGLESSVERATLAVKAEAAWGRALTLQLDASSRDLLAVDGILPSVRIRRKAGAPTQEPPPWFEHVGRPPTSALDVFVSFGRGYHLPKRELLEAAFHWPSMREAEIAAGSYPADVTLEKVREDWVAEFERMSKHRTEADCDDLLMQLLTTATITTNADGSVTIASLPVFGGHSYTCAALDGRWWITKID